MPTARRTLTLTLLLVAAGSLIFTTGAAVVDGPADTAADGNLAVQPADGPNGQYAYLNDDDEIAIDVSASNPNIQDPSFEGVNVGATGTIDEVFTITYTGEQFARVWIAYPNESVAFVADGESIEGNESSVTLAPNGTVTIGLALDTRGATAGTRLGANEFSIEAELAEPEDMADSSPETGESAGEVDGGEPSVTVTSPSETSRGFRATDVARGGSVRFEAGGMHLAGGNVTLDWLDLSGVRTESVEVNAVGSPNPVANGSALAAPTSPRPISYLSVDHDFAPDEVDEMTIRFSADRNYLNAIGAEPEAVTLYRQTDAGEWAEKPTAVIDDPTRTPGVSADRVHFRATTTEFSTFAVAAHAPRFDVTDATVTPGATEPGEAVTVRATVRNGGGAAGERTVTLTADGDPIGNETVALTPNETATVALRGTVETAGTYEIALDGTPVGTLTVGDAGDGDARESAAGSGSPQAGGSAPATEPGDDAGRDAPTEEPGGVDLVDFGGLLAALFLAVIVLALFRRVSRS
ncbi:DUF1102 domain-containing protein [Halorubrum sp. SD690R]|uniref:CARDB domain-containing protein n=1 Tax=Halorubrum sp. SD690R TaxID=2518117 RepID=UPI0010F989AB|nr:CARDB domain-containing protein [Halorubrum sp. SD690R]TKX42186.1 DUF1102 domain-containing protein [Halorubrum sp. SD690R]